MKEGYLLRGGYRPGSGRSYIKGRQLKIKVPKRTIKQLNLFFPGKTIQEKIRDCLDYGLDNKVTDNNNIKGPNVIDLFSGAGGLSKGFLDAGFNVRLGVDFDDESLKTYDKNIKSADIMKLNLFNHKNLKYIIQYMNKKKFNLDVLIGGPPCQGYSLAGPRNKNDKRNKLYEAMVKFAAMTHPKVLLLENVPGLVRLFGGLAAKRIVHDFTNLGYNMQYKILYAPLYCVPQIRKRVFFIGVRKDIHRRFNYPRPILDKSQFITCRDAISDLPSLKDTVGTNKAKYTSKPKTEYQKEMRKGSKYLMNHVGTRHTRKTVKLISMVPEGKNYKALPSPYNHMFKYHEALTRLNGNKPSLTVNTGHRSHFHYKWNRIPTVRESARFQSFPDTYIFYGNKSQQYSQVGNAVPPLLGKAVAKQIMKLLKDK